MTLTVCVGASGSGKTTFLNDVHKSHKCTYIRQYHNLRPYIKVSAIPNFDETKLPYWHIYINEKKDKSIIVGGTIAGQFMPGLSGGQRKLLLFELIFQRTASQDNLLIVLDEPFAGVTDDFVPFIVKRLNEMRKNHNILLVTNDHVETLKRMADNTVTVSAIDRTKVTINEDKIVDRNMALLAMSIGDDYKHSANNSDLQFFFSVELSKNGGLLSIIVFALLEYGLYILTFWGSQPGNEAPVVIAASLVAFFVAKPYFMQLPDWRIHMKEEAEALLHSSKTMNKNLKLCLAILVVFTAGVLQYVSQVIVIGTMNDFKYFIGVLFDSFSIYISMIILGLFTDLPEQDCHLYGPLPYLFMLFFSSTFSPGSGVEGLKELKYLFTRYYLWCMLPVEIGMEGCPESNTLLYLFLSSLLVPFLFLLWKGWEALRKTLNHRKRKSAQREAAASLQFADLQLDLFGEKALKNLRHVSGLRSSVLERMATSRQTAIRPDDLYDDDDTLLNIISSSLLVPFLYALWKGDGELQKSSQDARTVECAGMQLELFGDKASKNLKTIIGKFQGGWAPNIEDMETLASKISGARHHIEGDNPSDEENAFYDAKTEQETESSDEVNSSDGFIGYIASHGTSQYPSSKADENV
mmetsp:Transcript_2398/g.4439  ORF Transcript_2398/g.4439 Transcript_2398/m.4439 type:complete len:637 (-) Transcript_2398:86-1996(-)|eukprot:CAMPEP_0183703528 /NCGR_PEP_ID=MMETSP0737-20130205/1239_1 /TAXON_ID=385413 /ORGANISM="Thalassiosira miniscula, Strain CCMP1093" /LENGTH=636 /DNA_ID=CAMNT_0025930297 /DNA_START=212 /DNA_END=2122 /DNA_ORIENTATION=+